MLSCRGCPRTESLLAGIDSNKSVSAGNSQEERRVARKAESIALLI